MNSLYIHIKHKNFAFHCVMTHLIATAKCQTVLSSGNYGMSQNRYTDDSKEYIFVKFTDSAYRAIEEYQLNEHANRFLPGQCAKIQFIGNSGVIHFPTPDGNSGISNGDEDAGRKFGFAIDDVEGSLECIQQQQHDLDVLGALSLRMRIQANDDVYDTTRTKMAIAEETEKSKCIREIKPNQTDIGRKVKKPSGSTLSFQQQLQQHQVSGLSGNNNNINFNYLSSNNNNRTKSLSSQLNGLSSITTKLGNGSNATQILRSPSITVSGAPGTTNNCNSCNNQNDGMTYNNHRCGGSSSNFYSSTSSPTSASSLSSTFAGGILHGYASAAGNSPHDSSSSVISGTSTLNKSKLMSNSSNSNSRSFGGNKNGAFGSNTKNVGNGSLSGTFVGNGKKLPDISKRKIRDRLIHLLALKPFKKPELYSRLQNEGICTRERSLISNILKDISTLSRDNTYNLRRQMWNDVNENWPYFSEQELQQLKRRKPQNLTPPMSSDAGSSTSGQSPTSTHTGSPPPLVGSTISVGGLLGGNSGGNLKRTSQEFNDHYDDTYGVQAKKQRISHFKKENPNGGTTNLASNRAGNSNFLTGIKNGRNIFAPLLQQNNSQKPHQYDDYIVNTDLSYNVLNNIDDFITSHIEQHSGNGSANGSSINSYHVTGKIKQKEKQSYVVNNTSPSNTGSGAQQSYNKKPSPKLVYGKNFVPESSLKNKMSSISNNNSNNRKNIQQQDQSYKTSNNNNNNNNKSRNCSNNNTCVIYSNQHEENNKLRNSSAKKQRSSSSSNGSREQLQNISLLVCDDLSKHQQQQLYYKNMLPSSVKLEHDNGFVEQQHQFDQQHPYEDELEDQQQNKQLPSPTQQIAEAAANAYSPHDPQNYDFSNYTTIVTLEQRRRYKTEFENDYDEYRNLLEQVESVSQKFRELAIRLQNARQGCADYNRIKEEIFRECARIRDEESIKRDKERFDYLHAKLAHIKQLVTDYDSALTNVTQLQEKMQQQQQFHQQQMFDDTQRLEETSSSLDTTVKSSGLSPMGNSESNTPPPLAQYQKQYQKIHYQQHRPVKPITKSFKETQFVVQNFRSHAVPTNDNANDINNQFPHHNDNSAYLLEQKHFQAQQPYHCGNNNFDSDDSTDSSDSNDDGKNSNTHDNDDENNQY